jgi:hypothetical protein
MLSLRKRCIGVAVAALREHSPMLEPLASWEKRKERTRRKLMSLPETRRTPVVVAVVVAEEMLTRAR